MIAALLLTVLSATTSPVGGLGAKRGPGVGMSGHGLRTTNKLKPTFLDILPAGVGYSNTASSAAFFLAYTSSLSNGAWWFLNDDGTSQAGGLSLPSLGLPVDQWGGPLSQYIPTCSNGTDCAPLRAQRTDGTDDQWLSASTPQPTGDFSVGIVFQMDVFSNVRRLIDNDSGPAQTKSFIVETGGTEAFNARVYKTDASFTQITGAANALYGETQHFLVITYDEVGDGSSILTAYLDGAVTGTPSTTAVASRNGASAKWSVAAAGTSIAGFMWGRTRLAFMTETVLDATTISNMNKTISGVLSTKDGTAVTVSRAGPFSCTKDNWATMTTVAPDRACISGHGLQVAPAATNLLLHSLDIQTTWTTASASVAAEAGTFVDSSIELGKVTPSGNGGGIQQSSTVTSGTGPWTASAWFGSTTGTATARLFTSCLTSGNAATCSCSRFDGGATVAVMATTTCSCSTDVTTAMVRMSNTLTCAAANTTIRTGLAAGTSVSNALFAGGAQFETGAVATPYIPTFGTATARAVGDYHVALPATVLDADGCVRVRFHPNSITANAVVLGHGATTWTVKTVNSTSVSAFDGTNTVTATVADMTDRDVNLAVTWTGSTMKIYDAGVLKQTGSYDGSMVEGTTVYLGTQAGSANPFNGRIGDVAFGTTSAGCI